MRSHSAGRTAESCRIARAFHRTPLTLNISPPAFPAFVWTAINAPVHQISQNESFPRPNPHRSRYLALMDAFVASTAVRLLRAPTSRNVRRSTSQSQIWPHNAKYVFTIPNTNDACEKQRIAAETSGWAVASCSLLWNYREERPLSVLQV